MKDHARTDPFVPSNLSSDSSTLASMGVIIALTDPEWAEVEDLFDPGGKRGAPPRYPRREMVEAILFLARTGCQWRYLPDHYPPWEAVWQQWRRWRENGVWARAMTRIAHLVRERAQRKSVEPTMVMIDAQTVRGGRAGPTFHDAGGRGEEDPVVAVAHVGRALRKAGMDDRVRPTSHPGSERAHGVRQVAGLDQSGLPRGLTVPALEEGPRRLG